MMRATRFVLLLFLFILATQGQDVQANRTTEEYQARIEILWPHSGAPVSEADRANLLVYMLRSDGHTLAAICNTLAPSVLIAVNSDPARWLESGKSEHVNKVAKDGRTFPAWEYRDIDVSLAKDSRNRLFFTLPRKLAMDTPGKISFERAWTNVWAHGQDARTYFPAQDVPIGVDPTGEKVPDPEKRAVIDAKIEVVWPHGGAPVVKADKANVAAMLFRYDTLYSVPPEFDVTVTLLAGLNQDVLKPVAVGQKRLVTANGITYPVWDFNNVDVSAAKDPRNKYFFMLDVASYPGQTPFGGFFSNIWVHGADGRTYFPEKDVPTEGCP